MQFMWDSNSREENTERGTVYKILLTNLNLLKYISFLHIYKIQLSNSLKLSKMVNLVDSNNFILNL